MAFLRPEKRPEGCAQPHDLSCEMGFGEDFPQQAKRLWITRGIACHDLHFVLLLDIFLIFYHTIFKETRSYM